MRKRVYMLHPDLCRSAVLSADAAWNIVLCHVIFLNLSCEVECIRLFTAAADYVASLLTWCTNQYGKHLLLSSCRWM
jgi:hypothetical protein